MTIALAGCQYMDDVNYYREGARTIVYHDSGTAKQAHAAHREFRWQHNLRSDTFRNKELINRASPRNSRVEISLGEQRGLLLVSDKVAMDFPVATGLPRWPTPAGQFTIIEKNKAHRSNLYGRVYDSMGILVDASADSRKADVPPGGRFVGASMPYWMRLTNTGIGMHVGYVPGGRPASHGCIRLRRPTAATIFNVSAIGTPVTVAYGMPALSTATAPRVVQPKKPVTKKPTPKKTVPKKAVPKKPTQRR